MHSLGEWAKMQNRRSNRQARQPIRPRQGRVTELKRRIAVEDSAVTVQIITNGKQTELAYLNALVREGVQSPAFACKRVKFINGAPALLVKKANAMIREGGLDYVYAVADKDEFDISSALKAQCEGVNLLISNPCFEVWLILHFDSCESALEGKEKALERLRRYLPKFDPDKLDFSDFSPHVDRATQRAKWCTEAPHRNPSTTLWRLVDALNTNDQS